VIDLRKPTAQREPLELIEHTFYSTRLEHDAIVRAMELLQAAGAKLVEMDDVEASESPDEQTVIDAKNISSEAGAMMLSAYRELSMLQALYKERIGVYASYLALHDVEVAGTMKELMDYQVVFQNSDGLQEDSET
jgi:hypothetical protein